MSAMNGKKCVILLKEGIPNGFAANAAAILAASLGKRQPEMVGEDIADGSNTIHAGLVTIPIPVLKASGEVLQSVYRQAQANGDEVDIISFSDEARRAKTYDEYRNLLNQRSTQELEYLGVALVGPKKIVSQWTSGLSLWS